MNRRHVPIHSVVAIDGSHPRVEIDSKRIEYFKELYREGAVSMPPVEVLLIQSGVPGTEEYAIEDGLHRFLAQKMLKQKKVDVQVNTGIAPAVTEKDSVALKKYLLVRAAEHNVKHLGMPLSQEDRKATAKMLYQYGSTPDEIAALRLASRPTIYRWLESEIEARRQARIETVARLVHREAPQSQNALAQVADMPRTTLQRLMKKGVCQGALPKSLIETNGLIVSEAGEGFEYGADEELECLEKGSGTMRKKDTFPGTGRVKSPARGDDPDALSQENNEGLLAEIYHKMTMLRVTPEVEHEIKFSLLPLLTSRYEGINKMLNDGGYADELRETAQENERLRLVLRQSNQEVLKRGEMIEKLGREITSRTEHCKYDCPYTGERLKEEFGKIVKYMLDTINKLVKLVPRIGATGVEPLRALTFDQLFRTVSVVEWMDDNGLTDCKTREYFDLLQGTIAGIDSCDDTLTKRVCQLEKRFRHLRGVPGALA
ncbi:MAG: hypothetical protein U0411_09435 [Thermodesulfovibrionales bacterium]